MTPARRRDAERNRNRVIEAGIELLGRDPDASILDVAEASGVGRTTFYRHFSDREDLVDTVLEEVLERARRASAEVAADPSDPVDAIRRLSAVHLDIALRFGSLIQSRNGVSTVVEAAKDAEMSPTRTFLEHARQAGTIRTDSPLAWQQTVMRVVTLTAVEQVEQGAIPRSDAHDLVAATLVAILVPPERG